MKIKYIPLFFISILTSCGTGFLDEKPDIKQRVPHTLDDYMGLLDNTSNMNGSPNALALIGSDDYYITKATYDAFPSGPDYNYQRRAYGWEPKIFEGGETSGLDWNLGYGVILWANLVLDGVNQLSISSQDQKQADMVKGSALFFRAWNYYLLAQLFCQVYDRETAKIDLGLPLRLGPDLTSKAGRSNLEDTYRQVIKDLIEAEALLPETPEVLFRPSKAAVDALLSRLYLQMGDYQQAYEYSSRCLMLKPGLLDYNMLDFTKPLTFAANGMDNPEVIFMSYRAGNSIYLRILLSQTLSADQALISSYGVNDLRLIAYYRLEQDGRYAYKGSYDGSNIQSYFTGLAVDEVYLTHAECAARLNNPEQALHDLNLLRNNRFKTGSDIGLSSNEPLQILDWILEERRKELVLRGTRWEDLRRLNKEPVYAKTLVRVLGDQTKELPPNDPKYVWPLTEEAIQIGGYEQNPR